jgi:hypothetical protein
VSIEVKVHRGKPTGLSTGLPFGRFVFWLIREHWEAKAQTGDAELMKTVEAEFPGRPLPQRIADYRSYCRTRPHMMGKGLPRLAERLSDIQRQEYAAFKNCLKHDIDLAFVTAQVAVGEVRRLQKTRIGQSAFRTAVLRCYSNNCCFPECDVDDALLLVAGHIDRWADSKDSRGNAENGLCLCALHDRAYELGLFVIDDGMAVQVNKLMLTRWATNNLLPFQGAQIRTGRVKPSPAMLSNHRKRHAIVVFRKCDSS